MTKTTHTDKQLWQRYRQLIEENSIQHPDANMLAGYLDKKLSKTEHIQLEQHLSQCPLCLTHITALHDVAPTPVPDRIIHRAKSLLPEDKNSGYIYKFWPWLNGLTWVGSFSIFVITAFIGFNMGTASFEQEAVMTQWQQAEVNFDLGESSELWDFDS